MKFLEHSNIHQYGDPIQSYPTNQQVFYPSGTVLPPSGSYFYWTITQGKTIYSSLHYLPPRGIEFLWAVSKP